MAPETLIAWIWSELAAQAARLPRFQINEGVLQSKMRWLLVFVVVFHEERTPLWHNDHRQVGAGRPPARHQVVSGVAPSKRS